MYEDTQANDDTIMTIKLKQKIFLQGSRQFEIIDDVVFVRVKSWFKEQNSTVSLSTLDPEPVIQGSELAFYSRYRGRPVLTLLLNNPSTDEFNRFVDLLKQNILGDDGVEADSPETSRSEALAWNVYEEPPEFTESDNPQTTSFQPVNVERLIDDIRMLKTYLVEEEIKHLLGSLDALKAEPQNEAAFLIVLGEFNKLGINQGAVLTYAPYLKALISNSL